MKEFALFVVAISWCVVGFANADDVCPKSPGFRLSDEAKQHCGEKADDSLDECKNYIELLENEEKPTAQQRLDLLDGLLLLGNRAENEDQQEALDQRMLQLSRELHEEYPNDVQIMWYLTVVGDEDARLKFQRRIAELAPDCNHNNRYFAENLDRRIGHGRNRAQQDEDLVQEFVSLLDQGYEHAERRWDKMNFGHRRYREYLLAGEQDLAKTFWNHVVAELDPGSFPQDNTHSYGWALLCGELGFNFRFAEICLDTIEQTLKEALESETSIEDYGYGGVLELAQQLVHPWFIGPSVLFPGPPNVHWVSFRPYRAAEGARILIRLRDLLESVPKESRTDSFDKAYKYVLGRKPLDDPTPTGLGYELVPSPSDPDIRIWESL